MYVRYKTLNWIHIKQKKQMIITLKINKIKKNSIKNESHLEKMIISKEHEDKNSLIQYIVIFTYYY